MLGGETEILSDSPGSWVKWLNDACLFTKNASSVMRASCSIAIFLNRWIIHILWYQLIYPTPVFCILFLSESPVLHLFLYSFNPSTLHSTLKTKQKLISPNKKTRSCRQSESSSIFSRKIYAYFFTGRGSLFPMFFLSTSEILPVPRCGNMPSFFFGWSSSSWRSKLFNQKTQETSIRQNHFCWHVFFGEFF